jgi:phosphomannomutase
VPYSDTIFKAYDTRGVYPTELNEEAAQAVGQAVAKLAQGGRVVVGRDMRLSSPQLHQALIKGLRQGGSAVDDLDLVPIDAVYFAVGRHGYEAGVMVTASHNPPEYNGFKVVGKGAQVVRGSKLKEFVDIFNADAPIQGSLSEFDIWPSYLEHVRSFVRPESLRPLKVVVDAGNGMAGKVLPTLFNGLPFKLTPLFFELDGSFPNRQSNPLLPGASDAVAAKVKAVGADVGVMFDGDTDRVFFLDEQGVFVPADVTLLLLAREFLNREPGAAVVYNLICSRAVPEFIERWGGRPVRSAVGYVNMREALVKQGAVMGGELSAHYSFRDNYGADSGMIALLLVLELLSQEGKALSELVHEFSPYAKAPEMNLKVADKDKVLAAVRSRYHDAQIDELDGVTISYPDWWVNVRPSNTEPLLRVTIEANDADLLSAKHTELKHLIESV